MLDISDNFVHLGKAYLQITIIWLHSPSFQGSQRTQLMSNLFKYTRRDFSPFKVCTYLVILILKFLLKPPSCFLAGQLETQKVSWNLF